MVDRLLAVLLFRVCAPLSKLLVVEIRSCWLDSYILVPALWSSSSS